MDTRLLGKPVAFETSWRSFKFQFAAYCGAIDSRLKDLLVWETRDVAASTWIRARELTVRNSTTC